MCKTYKAEQVIAEYFHGEGSVFVRGSGTNAIRYAISSAMQPMGKILVHKAPVYSTTQTTLEMFGLRAVVANFNDLDDIRRMIRENPDLQAALVQYTRQTLEESYDMAEVLQTIRSKKICRL